MNTLRAVNALGAVAGVAFALIVAWGGLDAPAKLAARRRRLIRECGAFCVWFTVWAAVDTAVGLWPLGVLFAVAAGSFAVAAFVWSRAGAR